MSIGYVGTIGRLMSTTALRRPALPLDQLSAALALSLRLLRSAYTGACIRVRRTLDGAEMNIPFKLYIPETVPRLDLEVLLAFTGAGSGFVTAWYDQSGNGRNASQVTALNQPRIVNNGLVDTLNGRPAISFDGGGQTLTTARVLSVVQNTCVNYVGTSGRNNSTTYSLNGNDQTIRYTLHAPEDGFFKSDIGGTGGSFRQTATFTYGYNAPYIFTSVNTSIRQIRGNSNVLNVGTIVSGTLAQGTAQIGATLYPGNYVYQGSISEFIVFSEAVSIDDIQRLERNQGAYYGIAAA